MFGPKQGSWWLTSSDKRWCVSGRTKVGGFEMPSEAKSALEKLKKELNEEPPSDLEWGYMKD